MIDSLAIFATLFGSATSLGLGALQINGGMDILWGVDDSNGVAVPIIAVLTVAFVLSAVSGVAKGIQWLSNANMVLAGLLLLFLLDRRPDGVHLRHADRGGRRLPDEHRPELVPDRRVRRPRVARLVDDLLLGVVDLVGTVRRHVHRADLARTHDRAVRARRAADPERRQLRLVRRCSAASAIDLQLSGAADLAAAVGQSPELALFTTLEQFPLSDLTSFLVIVLVALFFVSGADAASVVMGMLSCRGALNPPRGVVILWGVLMGAAASVLLLAGGLEALQHGGDPRGGAVPGRDDRIGGQPGHGALARRPRRAAPGRASGRDEPGAPTPVADRVPAGAT